MKETGDEQWGKKMDKSDFETYLVERYEDQVDWYGDRSGDYKKKYQALQWGLIILAALTPVFVMLDLATKEELWLKALPIMTSVLVAIFASALKTFRFQETWLEYRTTAETLKKEKYLYLAEADEYAGAENKQRLFVLRVENLISRENTAWAKAWREDKDEQPAGP